jgi:hypothetical protein
LKKSYDKLTILEITTAAEERIPSVFECSPSVNSCPSDVANTCTIWPLLNNLQNKINVFLKDLTLKELLTKEFFKNGVFLNANYGLEVKLSIKKVLELINNLDKSEEIFFLITDLNLTYQESKDLHKDINKNI